MKSIIKFVSIAASLSVVVSGSAFAGGAPLAVPEPGSLALVGLAVAALVAFSRKGKK